MSGAVQPASSMRCLISGTAAAASGTLTVTRTISSRPRPARCTARGRARVRRIGHRHRLDDDRRAAADLDAGSSGGTDLDADSLVEPDKASCLIDRASDLMIASRAESAPGAGSRVRSTAAPQDRPDASSFWSLHRSIARASAPGPRPHACRTSRLTSRGGPAPSGQRPAMSRWKNVYDAHCVECHGGR